MIHDQQQLLTDRVNFCLFLLGGFSMFFVLTSPVRSPCQSFTCHAPFRQPRHNSSTTVCLPILCFAFPEYVYKQYGYYCCYISYFRMRCYCVTTDGVDFIKTIPCLREPHSVVHLYWGHTWHTRCFIRGLCVVSFVWSMAWNAGSICMPKEVERRANKILYPYS